MLKFKKTRKKLKKILKKHFELLSSYMPRRYYRSYKKNYVSGKKKWAPYLKDVTPATVQIPAGSVSGGVATCVLNSPQDATPTPTIIKVKHCKVSFDFQSSIYFKQGFVCLCFVPQGVTASYLTPIQHPEWLLAWRGIETGSDGLLGRLINLSSPLARNLNSGDSICIIWSGFNGADGTGTIGVTTYARFSCVVRNN